MSQGVVHYILPLICSGFHGSEVGIILFPFPSYFIHVDTEISGTELISSILYFEIYYHQMVLWVGNLIFG